MNLRFDSLSLPLIVAMTAVFTGCGTYDPKLAGHLASVTPLITELPTETLRGVLNLDIAIDRAVANSDEIVALATEVGVASQRRLAAWDIPNPILRQRQTRGTSETEERAGPGTSSEDSWGYRVGLRFYIPNPWQCSSRVSAESANIYAAIAELVHAKWLVANNIQRLFVEIHYLQEDLKVVSQLADIHQDVLELMNRRAAQRQATARDTMTASRRYLAALSDRDETVRDLARVRRELASLVAASADDMHIVVDNHTLPVLNLANVDRRKLEKQALNNRADLSALFWRTSATRALYREAVYGRIPWFDHVQLGYAYALQEDEQDDTESDTWRVRTALVLPVFSWSNHETDILRAEYRGADTLERKAGGRVAREIRDAMDAIESISRNRAAYEREIQPIVNGMQTVLDNVKTQSGIDPGDVAEIRQEILESQRIKLESWLEYHLAVIRLQEVLGKQMP